LPQEKQPNAASLKPAISFSFVVGPTSEKQFFPFTKRYYVWLRVNLTRSHTPKRPLRLELAFRVSHGCGRAHHS